MTLYNYVITIGTHGCDIDDGTLREEEGYVNTKNKFPLTMIGFGGIAASDYASVTLGPLKCSGGNDLPLK